MHRDRLIRIVVLSLIVSFALATAFGCQAPALPAQSPAAQVPKPEVPAPEVQAVKVGVEPPLTGPAAFAGLVNDRFIRMGIDDVNAKGGVKVSGNYRLEL